MKYIVLLHPKAGQSLEKLHEPQRKRVITRLKRLSLHLKGGKLLKLGRFYNVRVGDYRAIYEIWENQKKVIVLHIGHGRGVYDEFVRWI